MPTDLKSFFGSDLFVGHLALSIFVPGYPQASMKWQEWAWWDWEEEEAFWYEDKDQATISSLRRFCF